jgi:hypothetical protein
MHFLVIIIKLYSTQEGVHAAMQDSARQDIFFFTQTLLGVRSNVVSRSFVSWSCFPFFTPFHDFVMTIILRSPRPKDGLMSFFMFGCEYRVMVWVMMGTIGRTDRWDRPGWNLHADISRLHACMLTMTDTFEGHQHRCSRVCPLDADRSCRQLA